jgi:cell division protein FtsB
VCPVVLRPIRLAALGGVVLLSLLYWKPLHTYMSTRHQLEVRRADVRELRSEKSALERRIAQADTPTALTREARLIGLVKPGERLFIVRGIGAWRQHQK